MISSQARRAGWRTIPAFLCGMVGWICLWASFVGAVTVSVSEFDLRVGPGGQEDRAFRIHNEEGIALDIRIELVDWNETPEGGVQFLAAGSHPRSCAAWISVAPVQLTIPPGEERAVQFSLDVPQDVRGTHWCGLLLRVRPIETATPSSGGLRMFFVKVFASPDGSAPRGSVSDVRVVGLHPITAHVRFHNEGQTRLTEVTGRVVVEDPQGIQYLDEPIESFDLLPGGEITLVVEGRWGLDQPGIYLVRAVLDYGGSALVAGQAAFRIYELALSPLTEDGSVSTDLNGDGLYEDIDGDGRLTPEDPRLLQAHLASPVILRNARAFDFDNNGMVDNGDVERLARLVLEVGG